MTERMLSNSLPWPLDFRHFALFQRGLYRYPDRIDDVCRLVREGQRLKPDLDLDPTFLRACHVSKVRNPRTAM
jgi:hypothetical protein